MNDPVHQMQNMASEIRRDVERKAETMERPIAITIEVEYAADAGEDVGAVGRAFHEIVTEQEGVERAKVYVGYQQELVAG